MTEAEAPPGAPVEERHASWLELFFDLVVVAGIGQLAHLLSADSTGGGLALYVVAYVAFWLVWACFTAYSNIVGERAHVVTMLGGMLVLGVMTAAVPEIRDEHARAFAVAYVLGRLLAARPWRQATVVVDLPLVQAGFGVVPWIASIWVEGTARYVLWAVGLALDLLFLVSTTRDRLVADSQRRLDRMLAAVERRNERARREAAERAPRGGRPGGRGDPDRELPTEVEVAGADVPHLGERLSLFVLIVLGESVVQVIDGAAEADAWDRQLAATALGAFLLLVGLWGLAVRRGSAGVALLAPDAVAPRLAWAVHLVATGALATMAAVLAGLVEDPGAPVVDHDRWLVVGAFGAYGLLCAVVHAVLAVRAPARSDARHAAAARALCVGVPSALAVLVGGLLQEPRAEVLVWVLAGAVALVLFLRGRLVAASSGSRTKAD